MTQNTQNFERAFSKLNGIDSKSVRSAIITRCGWKNDTQWNFKRTGKRSLSINERDIIESIFRAYGLNAWTGNPINQPEICTS